MEAFVVKRTHLVICLSLFIACAVSAPAAEAGPASERGSRPLLDQCTLEIGRQTLKPVKTMSPWRVIYRGRGELQTPHWVELVIPPDDPSEPCCEAETVKLLKEVKERAERGDVSWLKQHGKVYAAMGAA
jgi:hypothetical protein